MISYATTGGRDRCPAGKVRRWRGGLAFGLILVLLFVGALAGCGPAPSGSPDGPEDVAGAEPQPGGEVQAGATGDGETEPQPLFPLAVVDGRGQTVSLEQKPQRIISIAPSVTEILFALDCGDSVVGVDENSDYPPEAKEKESVGGYYPPNIEKIVGLNPDLVVGQGLAHQEAADQLEGLGVTVLLLPAAGVDDVLAAIELLGRAAGVDERGRELSASIRGRIAEIRRVVDGIPEEDRPRVYYEVWDDPLMSAGPGSLIAELIGLAGGSNIVADAEVEYPVLSPETIIARDPEVIVFPLLHRTDAGSTVEDFAARSGWDGIAAVVDGRVAGVDDNVISRPGPRVAEAIELLAGVFHPQLFD